MKVGDKVVMTRAFRKQLCASASKISREHLSRFGNKVGVVRYMYASHRECSVSWGDDTESTRFGYMVSELKVVEPMKIGDMVAISRHGRRALTLNHDN